MLCTLANLFYLVLQWRNLGPNFSSRPMHYYYYHSIHGRACTVFTFLKQCWVEKKKRYRCCGATVIISDACALLIIEQETQEKIAHSLRSGTLHMKHLFE